MEDAEKTLVSCIARPFSFYLRVLRVLLFSALKKKESKP
jgi:hypothetical protein